MEVNDAFGSSKANAAIWPRTVTEDGVVVALALALASALALALALELTVLAFAPLAARCTAPRLIRSTKFLISLICGGYL